MSAWDITKGLLYRDLIGIAATVGVVAVVVLGGLAFFVVKDWVDSRRRRKSRAARSPSETGRPGR